jgi:hypothetical protein
MKLPNFYDFEPLNRVKQRMGIPRDRYGGLDVEIKPARLTPEMLDQLGKEGREVSFKELEFLPNGTVAFGGVRVLVYIRDRSAFAGMPKFHFASCATLVKMHNVQKIDRFVVATRMDGWFDMNITGLGQKRSTKTRLAVCKNCLDKLQYNGYSHNNSPSAKQLMVSAFSIPQFFEKYPVSLIDTKPHYNSDNAPINDYTGDWDKISLEYRQSVQWRCESGKCGRILAQAQLRQYLHSHHQNGVKYDNKSSNLMALCIECHADQPDHGHLKASPQYAAFIALNL